MKRVVFGLIAVTACLWGQEGTGQFPAVLEQDTALPTHTVYRPNDLAKLQGQKLPLIVWGNGACVNNGLAHRNFLMEIASHGFLAIAIGPPQAPQPSANKDGKQAAPAGPATKSTLLIDAINWAVGEKGRKDSKYHNKIDTSKIAAMGMSCGGIQAYAVAEDPRIKLIGIWNSGILNAPINGKAAVMEDIRKDQLEKLHTPIFYITGDKTDIAFENGLDDFKRVTKVPAFHAYKDGVGHGGTYSQPNGGEFGKVGAAMLKWQFKDDKEAAKLFLGADCGLCVDTTWHVSKKGFK